ncbi:hypothetical protein ACFTY7_33870 [Streptomyces sp. NPDC057062]|uniref:hypothetical protein n=1 Tax=unclassified Streptomyces TaxID=2593676 RepID=UPI001C6E30FD|nr:hypothetical protein [Streptomyces sp. MBT84]
MQTLSTRTLSRMIKIAKRLPKSDILDLIMEADLWSTSINEEGNRQEILRTALMGARASAIEDDDVQAHQGLLAFAGSLFESELVREVGDLVTELAELSESLRTDGWEVIDRTDPNSNAATAERHRVRIVRADSAQVYLRQETNALEHELEARGYKKALGHYREALSSFAGQKHASSNGQLRTALEALVVSLAVDHTGYEDNGRANQGGTALKTLYSRDAPGPVIIGKPLPTRDGGTLIQGVWDISHTNGSHPGLSDAQEARIRMQLITGVMMFLLRHFPA